MEDDDEGICGLERRYPLVKRQRDEYCFMCNLYMEKLQLRVGCEDEFYSLGIDMGDTTDPRKWLQQIPLNHPDWSPENICSTYSKIYSEVIQEYFQRITVSGPTDLPDWTEDMIEKHVFEHMITAEENIIKDTIVKTDMIRRRIEKNLVVDEKDDGAPSSRAISDYCKIVSIQTKLRQEMKVK